MSLAANEGEGVGGQAYPALLREPIRGRVSVAIRTRLVQGLKCSRLHSTPTGKPQLACIQCRVPSIAAT